MKPRTAFLLMLLVATVLVASGPAGANRDAEEPLAMLSHEAVHATQTLPALPPVPLPSVRLRALAPDFETKMANEQPWRLSSLPGHSYLLHFWDDAIPVPPRTGAARP